MDLNVSHLSQFILICVFAWSVGSKLLDFDGFVRSLRTLPWLPGRLTRRIAVSVAAAEAGVALGISLDPRLGSAAAAALLLAFTAVVANELIAGRDFTCACFGSGVMQRPTTWRTVGRNVVLLVLAGASWMESDALAASAIATAAVVAALALLIVSARRAMLLGSSQ